MRRFVAGVAAGLLILALGPVAGASAPRRTVPGGTSASLGSGPAVTEDNCSGEVKGGAAVSGGSYGAISGSVDPSASSRSSLGQAASSAGTTVRLSAPMGNVAPGLPVGRPDFNGDGYADLAIGVTCEDVGTVADAGAVNVIYGSAAGLSATAGPGNQWWTQDSPGILDQAELSDNFGHVISTGDFNGDGYDDLVVGVREDLEGQTTVVDAGAINVIYGSAAGLSATAGPGNQFWNLNSPGIRGTIAQGDLWGRALAGGDFNRDGFQDLAVAAPNKDGPSGVKDSGAVSVLYGSALGLSSNHNQLWSQDSPGILDQREFNDQFGRALSAADYNGDGFIDLAIGPRHETIEGPPLIQEAGAVNVIYGSRTGLQATAGPGNQFWTQDSPGLAGDGSQASDWWGRPLKSGNFNGDAYADLAIGSFQEDLEGSPTLLDAGAVTIIYGGPTGLQADAGPGSQWFTQDSPGILDQAEANDWFSRWDTAGDFNNDGYADLVLGEPGEDLGSGPSRIDSAGAINVIYGGPNGLDANAGPGNQFWNQDSPGILDQAEVHDWFAHGNLVASDFNGDGIADLAAGVIFEDLEGSPTILDAGAVNVIYGSGNGLDASAGPGNQFWNENSPGISGDGAEDSDVYGGTLAAPGGD